MMLAATQTINVGLRHVPTWVVYAAGALPPVWLVYLGLTGGLGVEPIKTFEHLLGELALQMMIVTLAVTPLKRFAGIGLIKFRRAFGLLTFYYVTCHLLVWLFLDVGILSQIWADIVKRPHITFGMWAFVLLTPLAATSTNAAIRKMGPKRWKRLHQLGYAAAILGAVHYIMVAKTWQLEPLIYLGIIILLLLARIQVPKRA